MYEWNERKNERTIRRRETMPFSFSFNSTQKRREWCIHIILKTSRDTYYIEINTQCIDLLIYVAFFFVLLSRPQTPGLGLVAQRTHTNIYIYINPFVVLSVKIVLTLITFLRYINRAIRLISQNNHLKFNLFYLKLYDSFICLSICLLVIIAIIKGFFILYRYCKLKKKLLPILYATYIH